MLRKITPFLILSISLIIWAILMIIKETNSGWGFYAVIIFVTIGIVLFVIDYGLKKWLKNYIKIFLTQITIILIIVFICAYQFRKKTLIIPSDFDKEYVTIIYGVKNSDDLSISVITLNKKIEIPKNGILLTSSDFSENLQETDIKMDSGIYLNSDETTKGFTQIAKSEIEYNEKKYKFRTWKIQNKPCCFYTTTEIKKHKIELKKQLAEIKASR